ncbi:Nucleoporin NDC1 [Irineochytrium annulatum]|nr:Nucleoporin NDC1 [Irineochytrium annulatum]
MPVQQARTSEATLLCVLPAATLSTAVWLVSPSRFDGNLTSFMLLLGVTLMVWAALAMNLQIRSWNIEVSRRVGIFLKPFPSTAMLFSRFMSGVLLFTAYWLLNPRFALQNLILYPTAYGRFGPGHVNDRYILFLLYATIIGAVYSLWFSHQERNVLAFPRIEVARLFRRVPHAIKRSLIFSALYTIPFTVAFCILRGLLFRAITLLIAFIPGMNLSPSYQVRVKVFDLGLVSYFLFGALYTVTCWDVSDEILNVVLTESLRLKKRTGWLSDVLAVLKLGNQPYHQALGLYEVWRVARLEKPARLEIFTNSSDMAPPAWNQVAGECLSTLKQFTMGVAESQRKDNGKPGPLKAAAPTLLPDDNDGLSPKKLRLKENSVLQRRKNPGFLEAFQENRPKDTFEPVRPDKIGPPFAAAKLPALLQPLGPPDIAPAYELPLIMKMKKKEPVVDTYVMFSRLLRDGVEKVIGKRKSKAGELDRISRATFKNIPLVIWSAEALSSFIIAASREDKYGTVQRDIPVILDTLLRCTAEVESFIQRPPGQFHAGVRASQIPALQMPLLLLDAVLRTTIYNITTTLHAHIGNYTFEEPVALKLRKFLEFSE